MPRRTLPPLPQARRGVLRATGRQRQSQQVGGQRGQADEVGRQKVQSQHEPQYLLIASVAAIMHVTLPTNRAHPIVPL